MNYAAGLAAALSVLAVGASPASPADAKTWYIYCEGKLQDDHWAVFSENFWPHPVTEGYGQRAATAARSFFESHHDLQLDGCAAVSFIDRSLAQRSRDRTARLHRKMGDRVLFFPLPSDALSELVIGRAPAAPGVQRASEPDGVAPEEAAMAPGITPAGPSDR